MSVDVGDHIHCMSQVTKGVSQELPLTSYFFGCNKVSKTSGHFLSPPASWAYALMYHCVKSEFRFITCMCLTHTQNFYPKD